MADYNPNQFQGIKGSDLNVSIAPMHDEPIKTGKIEQLIDELSHSLDRLGAGLDELHSKFYHAMAPERSQPCDPGMAEQDSPSMSTVAHRTLDHIQQVRRFQDYIRNMIERCEL